MNTLRIISAGLAIIASVMVYVKMIYPDPKDFWNWVVLLITGTAAVGLIILPYARDRKNKKRRE